MRFATSALFGACLAVLPYSPSHAQYCTFPLEWPFCIAGAAINTAGTIATAPFRPYYYGPGYYYAPGYYYYRPRYYRSRYYYGRRHYYRRHYHHWH